jgi:ABC-type transport system substrate-binding protein
MNILTKGFLFLFVLSVLQSCTKNEENSDQAYDRNGNNVVVRIPSDIRTLNPTMAYDSYSLLTIRSISQYLATYDQEEQKIMPVLLKDLATITEDDGVVSYTMEIKAEAKWDDGTDITAKDVETSFKLLFNPMSKPTPYRSYLDFIEGFEIDASNNKKFTVRSSKKYILSEEALYMIMPIHQASIYDAESVLDRFSLVDFINGEIDESDESVLTELSEVYYSEKFTSDPAFVNGSGPYKLTEWKLGEKITLVKKPDWWGKAFEETCSWFKAYPDTVSLKPVADPTTASQMFSNNEFDVAISLDSKDFLSMSSMESFSNQYRFENESSNLAYMVLQNMKSPVLSDNKVRKAVTHLFDYDNIISTAFDGLGTRINSPVPVTKAYYDKEGVMVEYNLDAAASLLTEAGWADTDNDGLLDKEVDGKKTDLKLSFVISQSLAAENTALIFQKAASEVGMDVEIIKKDRKGWYELIQPRNFDLTMNGTNFSPGLDDFKQLFHTDNNTPAGQNRMQFGNADTDALLNAIVQNFDEESRNQQYIEFQKIVAEEAPIVWLISPLTRVIIHDRFEGGSSWLSPNICLGCMKLK